MTKAIDTAGIEKATGKSWEDWVAYLDGLGARDMPHPAIAKLAYKHIIELGTFDDSVANSKGRQNSSGWWSQSVTVAYEQHIGRRVPGQRADGTFEVSVTKTLDGNPDDAMNWWLSRVGAMNEFAGVGVEGAPKTSKTEKWRHWRTNLADGTRIVVSTTANGKDKALLTVTSQKLPTAKSTNSWRPYWKQFLKSSSIN